ncbi:uncharacterized protein LOC117194526 [Drosophila miranda]|uniref:uncharacterized protein LOC117194526 n=1 Tax=Drosophila miranda TaxID=7229 RepID=UPI00143F2352|nr:uncharacterized protein LOC117194526 [Drosophila miranda]
MRSPNYAHYASREFQEWRGSCWRGSSVGLIAGFIGIKLLLFVAISRRRLIRRFRSRHWILHLETYLGPHKALHRSIGSPSDMATAAAVLAAIGTAAAAAAANLVLSAAAITLGVWPLLLLVLAWRRSIIRDRLHRLDPLVGWPLDFCWN